MVDGKEKSQMTFKALEFFQAGCICRYSSYSSCSILYAKPCIYSGNDIPIASQLESNVVIVVK